MMDTKNTLTTATTLATAPVFLPFLRWVDQAPEHSALRFRGESLTYGDLERKSRRLASRLLEAGVRPGEAVGLCIERSFESIIAVLGILRAGAAYLPLDPAYPKSRIEHMLAVSRTRTVLVSASPDSSSRETISEIARMATHSNIELIQVTGSETAELPLQEHDSPLYGVAGIPGAKTAPAYVIFTSGSTGTPKGVLMPHGPLSQLISWQVTESAARSVGPGSRTLQFAPLSFDVSFQEIFSTLWSGGTLVLIDDESRLDGRKLARVLKEEQVNRLYLPVVALHYLADALTSEPALIPNSLREVITAGEALTITPAVRNLFKRLPGSSLVNQYGPSETHVVTAFSLEGSPDQWPALPPIGRVLPHVRVSILVKDAESGERRAALPDEAGEVFLGGDCLATGYVNRPDLTAEKFVEVSAERMYRTGDLARMGENGVIEFLGRADDQVKVRGYRIELGEIEVALNSHPGIRESAAAVIEWIPGEKSVVAYVVWRELPMTHTDLLEHLKARLPDYMIPSVTSALEFLPKTPSGKIDRRALPPPEGLRPRPDLETAFIEPRTPEEQAIAGVWRDLLHLERIGANDHLFDLGATSTLAVRSISRLRAALGDKADELSPVALFRNPTVAGIAALLSGESQNRSLQNLDAIIKRRTADTRSARDGVAIIGMSGRFPGASNVDELWKNLCEGVDSVTRFDESELDGTISSELRGQPEYVRARGTFSGADEFDNTFFGIGPLEAEVMDPQQRVLLEVVWEALEHAGYVPENIEGEVGVFAGVGTGTYYPRNILTRPDLIERIGEFQAMVSNEKDYVATRVSHKLNLKGPSVSVHTACSTSLVAICQAVNSLLSRQCDVAVAGAASVSSPIRSGYLYQEGGMFSKDGHTRAFDRDGSGTVFSDGAAVVVLKRIQDAVADGDTIYAVIRGAALNNDGSEKASFTAPSVEGQASVIVAAQAMAGVEPESIGYVETHGTATPLGDPIEIEALNLAFSRGAVAPAACAIGSIKSNIGHLTAAAGAAGLIKTVLSLKNEYLPASLHFRTPNPKIDFSRTPFRVQSEGAPWIRTNKPRRAGVSSFGVGGTNAHVVIEEAPPSSQAASGNSSPQLIVLSARTESALTTASARLSNFLKNHPETDLRDAAFTLQNGRREFAFRKAVVAATSDEAADALLTSGATQRAISSSPSAVFLFPGQGSQYAGMGSDLYQADALYRSIVDECAEILLPETGHDLRQVLMPATGDAAAMEAAAARLRNTFFTQPALFVTEYALARTFMALGVRPAGLIGHSVGEFVAATLAGVFRLEDALRLVARRGRMMSELPVGAMLSVRAPADQVRELLPENLSIASVNSPQLCVAAGPTDAVERFSKTLEDAGIISKPLHTSHAFHSAMMEPAVEPFTRYLEGVSLAAPRIPIFSTVTGKLLTNAEATDPLYWASHLRVTVDFSGGLRTALESCRNPVFVECGPRNVLSTLTRQHSPKAVVAPALGEKSGEGRELRSMLAAAGRLWTTGVKIDWTALHGGTFRRRIALPTYPFERKRFWAEPGTAITGVGKPPKQAERHPEEERRTNMNDERKKKMELEILSVLEDISGLELSEFPGETGFFEMGLDSLLLTQAANQFQRRFGVKVSFRQLLEELHSPSLVAAWMLERSAAAPTPTPDPARVVEMTPTPVVAPAPAPPSAQGPKPAFGAAARISTSRDPELSEVQRKAIADLQTAYNQRTAGSKRLTQQNRKHLADPRVVSGFRPVLKELVYPIAVERSKGSKLWDIDGNEYVDLTCGFGSNFFGNSPDFIVNAVREQLERGYEIGPQHPLAGEVAKLFCEVTGNERAALCNTGSEAVLGAMRLARNATARDLIVSFHGGYHGIVDEVIVRGTKSGRSIPAASGIPQSAVDNILLLEYGTMEALEVIRARGHEIAGVLVETVQSRRPDLQPREFLHELRRITQETGSALIFDEVITGFRIHPGGAQAHFGIRADLATYGKIVGGGMPIGVISGKSEFMDGLDGGQWNFGDESAPTVGVTYFAGTFVRHPLALAAAKATLLKLKEEGEKLQHQLNARASSMASELNTWFESVGAPLKLKSFGSLFKPVYTEDVAYGDLLFPNLRLRGVHIWDARPCFLTLAHSDADIRFVIEAFKESVSSMQDAGFLPKRIAPSARGLTVNRPPVAGARLGRDPEGRAAWFLPDPARPGKWLKLNPQVAG